MAGGRAAGSGRRPGRRWPRALCGHGGKLRGRPAGPIVCAGRRGGGAASPRGRRGAWYGPGIHAKRLWRTAPRLPPLLASRKAGGRPRPPPLPSPALPRPAPAPPRPRGPRHEAEGAPRAPAPRGGAERPLLGAPQNGPGQHGLRLPLWGAAAPPRGIPRSAATRSGRGPGGGAPVGFGFVEIIAILATRVAVLASDRPGIPLTREGGFIQIGRAAEQTEADEVTCPRSSSKSEAEGRTQIPDPKGSTEKHLPKTELPQSPKTQKVHRSLCATMKRILSRSNLQFGDWDRHQRCLPGKRHRGQAGEKDRNPERLETRKEKHNQAGKPKPIIQRSQLEAQGSAKEPG